LLNYVVPKSGLMAKAHEPAATGPLAVRKIKEGVLRSNGRPLAERRPSKTRLRAAVMTSKDARARPRAFKEKPAALHR
jgi:enoyl-CoA hydratase/carnithine racemase